MWNGSTQKPLGRADIEVCNPNQKKSYTVIFDVVPEKLTQILGKSVVQAMQLITVNTEQFDTVAHLTTHVTTREAYVEQYLVVFKSDLSSLEAPVSLHVDENITLTELPARSVPLDLRQAVKTELQHLQDFGVINPVEKPTLWVSQMVTVVKKDSSVPLCIDLRLLNAAAKT